MFVSFQSFIHLTTQWGRQGPEKQHVETYKKIRNKPTNTNNSSRRKKIQSR